MSFLFLTFFNTFHYKTRQAYALPLSIFILALLACQSMMCVVVLIFLPRYYAWILAKVLDILYLHRFSSSREAAP